MKFKEKKWKFIAELVPGRNHTQCLQRWRKVLRPGLVKVRHPCRGVRYISLCVREQYFTDVSDTICYMLSSPCARQGHWTNEEDRILVRLVMESPTSNTPNWQKLAENVNGRTYVELISNFS